LIVSLPLKGSRNWKEEREGKGAWGSLGGGEIFREMLGRMK